MPGFIYKSDNWQNSHVYDIRHASSVFNTHSNKQETVVSVRLFHSTPFEGSIIKGKVDGNL